MIGFVVGEGLMIELGHNMAVGDQRQTGPCQ